MKFAPAIRAAALCTAVALLPATTAGFAQVESRASPEFARVIREVPEGGVSRPFEDQQGWHIVKVDQLRKRRPPSLEDLRDTIERYLKSQQLEKILKQLRGQAEIVKRNPARASSMDKPAARPAPAPAADPVLETPLTPDPAAVLPATPDAATPATPDPAPAAAPPASTSKPATVTPAKPAPAKPTPAKPNPATPAPAKPSP